MDEIDELDNVMMAAPSPRKLVKMEHEELHKAASHPIRRKLIKSIGVFGKTKEELKNDMSLDNASFKYQTDFLLNGEFIKIEDDQYRLTDRGIDMLTNIK